MTIKRSVKERWKNRRRFYPRQFEFKNKLITAEQMPLVNPAPTFKW